MDFDSYPYLVSLLYRLNTFGLMRVCICIPLLFAATQHRDDRRVEAPERQLILPRLKYCPLAAALAVAGEGPHVH